MSQLIKSIKYFVRKVNASKIGAYSAQTAFFMFLSLIPIFIILLLSLRHIGSSDELLTGMTNHLTPNIVGSFFDLYIDEITEDSRFSFTLVSAFVLLWSASKGIFSIIGGLNSVYEIKENRNYFYLRFMAIFYTIAFIMILIIAVILFLFGTNVYLFFVSIFPKFKSFLYIITSLRFMLGFMILVLFFASIYKYLPNDKKKFSEQLPGAIFAGAGWVCFSAVFSYFAENSVNYSNIYGSLSTIIVLMLWLYVCMYILFLGAKINLIIDTKKIW